MKSLIKLLIAICVFTSCDQENTQVNIIPKPLKQVVGEEEFRFDQKTRIVVDNTEDKLVLTNYIRNGLSLYGIEPEVVLIQNLKDQKNIFRIDVDTNLSNLGKEGYLLSVSSDKIVLTASTNAGLFWGVKSFFQLFPQDFIAGDSNKNGFLIPEIYIEDKPRFSYRGMHLDVCRHMFSVEFIKTYLDLLAYYKFNTFHWHLTEDQGWRIEIKKYPKLMSVAAFRDSTLLGHYRDKPHKYDEKKYGGFYTQKEIKEIVKYAEERNITIIPEIEMPGHSLAALAAYPELACEDGPFSTATEWGVFEDVYCSRENTFKFLEDVLAEVIELFPGKYIHIGGDEVPKTRWENCKDCQRIIEKNSLNNEEELQSYFIKRIEKFINSKGRLLIGWDEILEGGLSPNATVMSWRGTEGGIEASKQGHDAIMTPGSHCYFDHYQANPEFQPLAIGGLTTLRKVYEYEPIPDELSEIESKHILGAQANVWTEYIDTEEQVEYMVLPRMAALAEVNWSSKDNKDWVDFQRRINIHFTYYENKGLNYCKGSYALDFVVDEPNNTLKITSEIYKPEIRFTANGTEPNNSSNVYIDEINLSNHNIIKAAIFVEGKMMEEPFEYIHK